MPLSHREPPLLGRFLMLAAWWVDEARTRRGIGLVVRGDSKCPTSGDSETPQVPPHEPGRPQRLTGCGQCRRRRGRAALQFAPGRAPFPRRPAPCVLRTGLRLVLRGALVLCASHTGMHRPWRLLPAVILAGLVLATRLRVPPRDFAHSKYGWDLPYPRSCRSPALQLQRPRTRA